MRRIKVIFAVTATVATLLAMMAGPAMANSWDDGCIGVTSGGECIGVGNDHQDGWNHWNGWNNWNGWNHWNGWNNSVEFDDCFWWDGELFCEVDW